MREPIARDRDDLDLAIDRVSASIVDAPGRAGAGRRVRARLPAAPPSAAWWPRAVAGAAMAGAVVLVAVWIADTRSRRVVADHVPRVVDASSRSAPSPGATVALAGDAAPKAQAPAATRRVRAPGARLVTRLPEADEMDLVALSAVSPLDLPTLPLSAAPLDDASSLVVAPLDIAPLTDPGDARAGDVHER